MINPLRFFFKGFIFFAFSDIIIFTLRKGGDPFLNTEKNRLISCMLDMGEEMLKSGAEISRVEDTLVRIGTSYGAKMVSVFGLSSNILITVEFDDGTELTRTRRITKPMQNDFKKLEALNDLSRRFCANENMDVSKLEEEFKSITQIVPSKLIAYLGNALASGAFALFFGGNVYDAIVASIFGLLICLMQRTLTPLCKNNLTFIIIASFITGLGISLLSNPFSFLHADKIMIGDIMLLVPGIAITNSVRDIFVGDTITGTMRFVESILSAGALAVGFMLAIFVAGGIQ